MNQSVQIKTIGDLRKATESLEDNFKIEIHSYEDIPKEELRTMPYPYPTRTINHDLSVVDIGYSDEIIIFGLDDE